jgi:hypothetical protein|tara:strand:- start:214 stop:456 length:243 start_codon:yes stop_codon:yes gene_type:complete
MKSKNILFIILAIIVVGAVFSIFYFSSSGNQLNNDDTIADGSQSELSEPQGEGLPRQVSVSTQEELFQEIRSAVDEHLSE